MVPPECGCQRFLPYIQPSAIKVIDITDTLTFTVSSSKYGCGAVTYMSQSFMGGHERIWAVYVPCLGADEQMDIRQLCTEEGWNCKQVYNSIIRFRNCQRERFCFSLPSAQRVWICWFNVGPADLLTPRDFLWPHGSCFEWRIEYFSYICIWFKYLKISINWIDFLLT